MREALHFTGNTQALHVSVKLANWLGGIVAGLTDDQMEQLMKCEYGGMNEVLADLYADTGDEDYLRMAEQFWHKIVLDPLAANTDSLSGKHANTQIPKLIGLARQYELTSDAAHRSTAEFFWDRVVHHHSYVIGGNSFGEYFGEPDQLSDRIGPNTAETCNTYNMLKLTRHLFQWNGSAKEADYYERALYNHILASQDPVEGGVCYFVSLAMGGYKQYNDKFEHFTCCVGTGMENHASYNNSIYFHSGEKLYVNQYIPSSLLWKDKGVLLLQKTDYPEDDRIGLEVTCERPVTFTMCIRYPYWAEAGIEVKINGESQQMDAGTKPGSYVEICRNWLNGDLVEITIPITLRFERMPDNPNRGAILYGPLVLAGELGELHDSQRASYLFTPVMIPKHEVLTNCLQPVLGKTNTFRTVDAGHPREVELYPFYRMHNKIYSVYWDLFTEEEWATTEMEYLAIREKMKILEQCTVDFAQPGEMQPERDHNFQGELTSVGSLNNRPYRQAGVGGWFAFDLMVRPQTDMMLIITYTAAKEMPGCEFEGRVTKFQKWHGASEDQAYYP